MGCSESASATVEPSRGIERSPQRREHNPLAHRPVATDVSVRRTSSAQGTPRGPPSGGEPGSPTNRARASPRHDDNERSAPSDLLLDAEDDITFFPGVSSAIAIVTSRRSSRTSIDSESNPGMSREADSSQTTEPTRSPGSSLRSEGSGSGSGTEFPSRSRRSLRIGSFGGADLGEAVRIFSSGRSLAPRRPRRRDSVEDLQDESDGDTDDPADDDRRRRLAGDTWEAELTCAIPSADDRYAQLRLDQAMFGDPSLTCAKELPEGNGLLWEHPDFREGLPCPLRFFPLLGSADEPATSGGFEFSSPWSKPFSTPQRKSVVFSEALSAYLADEAGAGARLEYFLRRTSEQAHQIRSELRLDKCHTAHRLSESIRNLTESFPQWQRLRVVANELTTSMSHYELLQVAGVQRLLAEMIGRGDDLAIPLCVWNRRQFPAEDALREFCRNRVEYALNVLTTTVKFVQESVPRSS